MTVDNKDLLNRFGYHAPPDQAAKDNHHAIRAACFTMAQIIVERVPTGREQALAFTKLEEVMMWSNAGIARMNPITEPLS